MLCIEEEAMSPLVPPPAPRPHCSVVCAVGFMLLTFSDSSNLIIVLTPTENFCRVCYG